jgi:hypothetical protein
MEAQDGELRIPLNRTAEKFVILLATSWSGLQAGWQTLNLAIRRELHHDWTFNQHSSADTAHQLGR